MCRTTTTTTSAETSSAAAAEPAVEPEGEAGTTTSTLATPTPTPTTTVTSENNNDDDDAYSSPENWYIFIVGNCEEWPEARNEQGDIGLKDSFIDQGVPKRQICFLKDDDCTQRNCQTKLRQFLEDYAEESSNKQSTFFFYYGGHGKSLGFCTLKNGDSGDDDDDDDSDSSTSSGSSSSSDDDSSDDGWYTIWSYQDVVDCIDHYYGGDRVVFLLDCCASGNLHRCLEPWTTKNTKTKQKQQKEFICLTPTPPYITATDEGDEWIVNNCWIKAMTCPTKPTLSTYMEFFVDRLALLMGDQAVITCSPNVDFNSTNWMPRRKRTPKSKNEKKESPSSKSPVFDWPRLENHIPSDGRVVADHWHVNDTVYYKHKGGLMEVMPQPINQNSTAGNKTEKESIVLNIPPCWLNATILSDDNDVYESDGNDEDTKSTTSSTIGRIRVYYQNVSWIVENVRRDQLMNDLYMAKTWMLPNGIKDAQRRLAKNFKYIDFSWPAHTTICAFDDDDGRGDSKVRGEATIIDWRDVDWEECLDQNNRICQSVPPFGGHVPIRWKSDSCRTMTRVVLLPVDNIVSDYFESSNNEPFLSVVPTSNSERHLYEREALIKSIESSGKTICHASASFSHQVGARKDDSTSRNDVNEMMILSVYWPQDGEWYDARPVDVNTNTMPLSVLASHVQFTPAGNGRHDDGCDGGGCTSKTMYCPVRYDEDGSYDLIPLHYVRVKQRGNGCFKMCRRGLGFK